MASLTAPSQGATQPLARVVTRRRLPSPRKMPSLYIGATIVLAVLATALLAPVISPAEPNDQFLLDRLTPPAWAEDGTSDHLLGTDDFGRDVLSRIIYGSRISLAVGILGVLIAGPIGVFVGLLAGYYGGRIESLLMRIADSQQSLPGILIAILVVATLGANVRNLIFVLALSSWVIYARIAFSSVRSLRDREFVLAALSSGVHTSRLLWRHILPNMLSPIIVISALQVGRLILLEAGLSFLGLGVPPPDPSWGNMLADGRNKLLIASWIATYPGLAISITVLGINLLGDGLRQILDPRLRTV